MSNRKEYQVGRIGRLTITVDDTAVFSWLGLWLLLFVLALWLLPLSATQAFLGSLIAVGLHVLATLGHHLGHVWAAQQVGYPMRGIHFWFLLATSRYPYFERRLPAITHIRRALGGPIASLLITLAATSLWLVVRERNDLAAWLIFLFTADSLLIFTLGAIIPLPFIETDGGTLLRWWPVRRQKRNG